MKAKAQAKMVCVLFQTRIGSPLLAAKSSFSKSSR
jgi:hypothetical protein